MPRSSDHDRYAANAKWLAWFAPFRSLTISAAYLTPFFLESGMNMTQLFALQSVFSVVWVLWEIPSGRMADRFGRARVIKLSVPIAAIAMILYGFSDQIWQFVLLEVALAFASGLVSGADAALLYDSLRADASLDEAALKRQYEVCRRRIKAAGFAAVLPSLPLALALVHFVGIEATLIADGLLLLVGWAFARHLVEAPQHYDGASDLQQQATWKGFWLALTDLLRQAEARWLAFLAVVLSSSTYLAAWASAKYYEALGLPLASFAVLYALRYTWKSLLAYRYGGEPDGKGWRKYLRPLRHKFFAKPREGRAMWRYAGLSGGVYLAMASGQWWLLPAILGHDIIHALYEEPISSRLNAAIPPLHRASLNSVVNALERLSFAVFGPLFGLLLDGVGLATGFVIAGVIFTTLASVVMFRLTRLGTFQERR